MLEDFQKGGELGVVRTPTIVGTLAWRPVLYGVWEQPSESVARSVDPSRLSLRKLSSLKKWERSRSTSAQALSSCLQRTGWIERCFHRRRIADFLYCLQIRVS